MAEKRNTRPKRSAKPGGKKTQPSIQGHKKIYIVNPDIIGKDSVASIFV